MKFKKYIALLTVIFIVFASSNVVADEVKLAESVSKQAQFIIDEKAIPALGDENLSTKHKLTTPQTIDVTSEKAVKSIYLMFDKPPQTWTLEFSTKSRQQGGYGFLHELVTFDTPQSSFSLSFEEDTIISDIYLFIEGELPSNVQAWEPPLEDCDMLLLPTHSDDEHVFFGGIMPIYAGEQSYKVQVAYINNHYGEWYRPHELLEGLWEVGIKNYPVIPDQFNDAYSSSLEHAKKIYDSEAMLAYEVELLRRFKPEVVIGHDLNGEYGHGAHMLNAELLTKAVELSGDETQYVDSAFKYGIFDVPKTYLHLYEKNPIMLDIDTPLQSFDGLTAYEVSVKGFAHHKSQQEFFTVNKGGKYDCRKFGLYRTTVGVDVVGKDLFENITVKSDELPESDPILPPAVVSSDPAVSSELAESKPAQPDDKSMLETLLGGSTPMILVIAGVVVIVVTMMLQNRRRKEKINQTVKAYKSAREKR